MGFLEKMTARIEYATIELDGRVRFNTQAGETSFIGQGTFIVKP